MTSKATIKDYLETITNAERDIFDAISIRNDGDEALRYRLIFRALEDIRHANSGIAKLESNRHIGAMLGGLRGCRRAGRDERGRFMNRQDAEQRAWDDWVSEREATREERGLGLL